MRARHVGSCGALGGFGTARALLRNRCTNTLCGLWPDPSAIAKALNDPAVIRADNPDAVSGKSRLSHQVFKLLKKVIVHARTIARYCVHINTRNCVRACEDAWCY